MDMFEYADTIAARPAPQNQLGMHRTTDPETSIAASERVGAHLTDMQITVYNALRDHGPMTDGELEVLPCFDGWRPSSARKRRGELVEKGFSEWTGQIKEVGRSKLRVWAAKVKV